MRRFIIVLSFLALALPAWAANYYVSTTGTDNGGCGAIGSPCATIAYVATNKSPTGGDTVHVAAGAYVGDIWTTANGTSAGSMLTYQGEDASFVGPVNCAALAAGTAGGAVTGCPRISASSTGTVWTNGNGTPGAAGNYVAIRGFDITGTSITYNGLYSDGSYTLMEYNHVHNVTAVSCGTGGGAAIDATGQHQTVINNYVHDIASNCYGGAYGSYYHGIYSHGSNGIYNNISFHNSGWGIQVFASSSPDNVANSITANNLVFANGYGGFVYGSDTAPNSTANGAVFTNNIAVNNTGYGFEETYNGTTVTDCCSTDSYSNNQTYGNSSGAYQLIHVSAANSVTTGTNATTFVNYTGDSTGDYHLKAGSAAIGSGISTDAYATDFDGQARPQGSSYDIGAYEYIGAATGFVVSVRTSGWK